MIKPGPGSRTGNTLGEMAVTQRTRGPLPGQPILRFTTTGVKRIMIDDCPKICTESELQMTLAFRTVDPARPRSDRHAAELRRSPTDGGGAAGTGAVDPASCVSAETIPEMRRRAGSGSCYLSMV
jgi:hypothetical protein